MNSLGVINNLMPPRVFITNGGNNMILLKIYSILILLLGIIGSCYKAIDNNDKSLFTGALIMIPILVFIIFN